jgi:hypothetical protein
MATLLSSPSVTSSVTANLTGGAAPAPSQSPVNHTYAPAVPLAVGSGAGQANKCYSAAFSVTSGAPLLLDLTALTDPLGGALNFTNVSEILITNDSTTAGQDFTIGAGTNGLFTAAPNVVRANGGQWHLTDVNPGITVDGTHKIFQIANASGTASGKITILGR